MTNEPTFYDGGAPSPLTPAQQLDNMWDAAAGATLATYAWIWPGGSPDWLVQSWWKCVCHVRATLAPDAPPAVVDWHALWRTFVNEHLAEKPEWKRAVGEAVGEPHIGGEARH